MKGWIKVHGKSEDGRKGCTMYVRTEHIVQVSTGVLAADESKEATCIAFRGEENSLYAVTESVDEVFALIEEAEKDKEKKSLLALLRSVKAECNKNEECETCKWGNIDLCPWAMSLSSPPNRWDLKEIPEEYR